MSPLRIVLLTVVTMLAFAGNSLLCRVALKETGIDAASFTSIRLVSGALVLWLIVRALRADRSGSGNWVSAAALFAYAAAFSYAYLSLTAATGALILFGAVQATMIGRGLAAGERFAPLQVLGLVLALGGLVGLLLPGLSAPPLGGALLMLAAGVAWGVYSLRGRGAGDATRATAGNFLRAVPLAALLCLAALPWLKMDAGGAALAVVSGAITSGLGYAIWYTALRGLTPQAAGSCQLGVPVITAIAGVAWLGEVIDLRLVLASIAVLGGIALTLSRPDRTQARRRG